MKRIEKLLNSGAAYRLSGIIECIDHKDLTPAEIEALKALKKDNVVIGGRTLATYAYAALDITGTERYRGKDEDIISFLKNI